jgi:outer membrane receptor protein involved in Fe transport
MTEKRLKRQDFTQEIRLASDFGGPLNFSVGGFYQDGKITNNMTLPGNTFLGLPPLLFSGTHDVDIRAISLFGQLRYAPSPQFEIAAGVRWTDEKRSNVPTTVDIFGAVTGVPGTVMVSQVAQPRLSAKNWSPELTLTYTPTDDLTIFASLKQAYKSGSYNLVVPAEVGVPIDFGDERIRGGELGVKMRLADRQINFNIAGYYYKVSDIQVQVNLPFQGVIPILTTLNAASAKIYGIEADFSYRPDLIDGLEIFGAVNYNRGRFADFTAPCNAGQTFGDGCSLSPVPNTSAQNVFTDPAILGGTPFRYTDRDLSGSRLTRSPDWSGNIGFFYETEIGSGLTLGFGSDAQFGSKYIALLGTDSQSEIFQNGYAKVNATITLKGENDAWEVAFIGNNLSDKLTKSQLNKANYIGGVVFPGSIVGGPTTGPAGRAPTAGVLDRGRELWIRMTFRPMALNGGR